MNVDTCKTCKWWGNPTVGISNFLTDAGFKECMCKAMDWPGGSTPSAGKFVDFLPNTFMTGPDFGCVYHEN